MRLFQASIIALGVGKKSNGLNMILINNFRKINEVKGNDMVVKRNPPKQSKRGSMLRKQLFDMILPGQDFMPRIHGGNRPAASGR